MSPDDVLAEAARHGVVLSRPALRWYHRQGMIERPVVRALGYGRGKQSDYPAYTPAELVAAHLLLGSPLLPGLAPTYKIGGRDVRLVSPDHPVLVHKITAEEIAHVREWAHQTTVEDFAKLRDMTPAEAGTPSPFVLTRWLEMRGSVLAGRPVTYPIGYLLGEPAFGVLEGIDPKTPICDLPGVPVT